MPKLRLCKGNELLSTFFKFPFLLIILASGTIFSLFFTKTFIYNWKSSYTLTWERASWISLDKPSPQIYFRKKLYIPSDVSNAWIRVSAQDSYIIYVNSNKAGSKIFKSSLVSGIYDLTTLLKKGENIISVFTNTYSYPSTCKLIAEGIYYTRNNRIEEFSTDNTWKAYHTCEIESPNPRSWLKADFDDSHWENAILLGKPYFTEILIAEKLEEDFADTEAPEVVIAELTINPKTISEPPKGCWIWHPNPNKKNLIFYKSINLTEKTKDAWVRISVNNNYSLYINGLLIGSKNKYSRIFDIYNITPFLDKGKNTFEIQAQGLDISQGLIADILIADTENKNKWFFTDSSWLVNCLENNEKAKIDSLSNFVKAEIIGKYGDYPWGFLYRNQSNVSIPGSITAKISFHYLFYIIIFIILIIGINILLCLYYQKISNLKASAILNTAILINLVFITFWCFVFILKFDTRLTPSFPYQLRTFIIGCLILPLLYFAVIIEYLLSKNRKKKKHVSVKIKPIKHKLKLLFTSNYFIYCAIVIIVVLGLYFRFKNIDFESLNTDEVHIIRLSKNILYKGFQVSMSYALLPYPIAHSFMLFGETEFSARLPSALLGTLTIFLIFYISAKLFDKRIGLLAAAIYAFNPWSIHWANNIMYPQTIQFLILLISYLFYKGLMEDKIKTDYIYLSVILFIIAYFNWGGIGLFFPSLILSIGFVKRKDLSWIKNRHVLISTAIVIFISFAHLIIRSFSNPLTSFYGIGSSKLKGKTIMLSLENLGSRNSFYFFKFMLSENHIILTILLILGLFIILKHRVFRYYFSLFIISMLIFSNFLPNTAIRYSYFLQTFLILLSSASAVYIIDIIKNLVDKNPNIVCKVSFIFISFIMIAILFLASNSTFLHLFYFTLKPATPPSEIRQNIYSHYADLRSSCQYIKDNYITGDIIISQVPNVAEYYLGQIHYMLETIATKKIFYGEFLSSPVFTAKKSKSTIAITNLNTFQEIMNKNNRIWLITTPYSFKRYNTKQVTDLVKKEFDIVYQTYYTKLYLRK